MYSVKKIPRYRPIWEGRRSGQRCRGGTKILNRRAEHCRYPVSMLAPHHPSNDGSVLCVPGEHRTSTGIRDLPIRDKSRIREIFVKMLETIVRLLHYKQVGALDCSL